jgi:hypothetical protein
MTDTTPPELSHAAVHIPVCGEEICSHTPQHIDIRLDRIVNPQDYYGLPQPADNPESTQPDQMVEFVRLGYAGASLHFRVQVSDTEMLWQCLYAAEGYLDVDAVGEAISGAAGLVSSVEFGREFSPVLYLHVPFWTGHAMTAKEPGESGERIPETERETIAARLMAIGKSLGAAETDVQLAPADAAPSIANAVICVRLWWD